MRRCWRPAWSTGWRPATPGSRRFSEAPRFHLTDRDRHGTELVVIINQAAARLYWPNDEALGQRVVINDQERVVAGVVGGIRHLGPEQPTRQECYLPLFQSQPYSAMLVVRTHGDPLERLPAVKDAIWRMDPTRRLIHDTPTIEAHMDRLIAQRRSSMVLLTLFGALGALIAAIGLYGVMSYAVRSGHVRSGFVWPSAPHHAASSPWCSVVPARSSPRAC